MCHAKVLVFTCRLPFGDGRNEQVTASLAAAKENTADDTVLLALSEWSGIITSV